MNREWQGLTGAERVFVLLAFRAILRVDRLHRYWMQAAAIASHAVLIMAIMQLESPREMLMFIGAYGGILASIITIYSLFRVYEIQRARIGK